MKRTSEDWQSLVPGCKVMDPDGWNREDFQFSWYQEEISWDEFERRFTLSTVMGDRLPNKEPNQ